MRTGIFLLALATAVAADPFESVPFWADEFDQNGAPDAQRWSYDVGGHGWGNQELQYYTQDCRQNARVEEGRLIVEAHRDGGKYTSARLVTKGKGDFTYGKWVVRARLPRGRGTWPAIWLLPSQPPFSGGAWPDNGEIDIMEEVGFDPNLIHSSIHCKAFNHIDKTQKTATQRVVDAQEKFHDYVLTWTPEEIRTYIDSDTQPLFVFRNPHQSWREWPFDQPFHLILNLAVGGFWGGAQGVDETIWPQRLEIDSVRYYRWQPAPAN
jgi:beta-glucanase (GH16 family)